MATVTVFPKFQIVIPKEFREKLNLQPREKLFMYELHGSLCVQRRRPIQGLRGIAKGLSWRDDYREHADRS
jgi:AbrB family looped-hinge helix DNA binding protein